LPGWNRPGYDDSKWPQATVADEPLSPLLRAQMIPPMRAIETLKPIAFWKDTQGRTVFDLGTNIAGWVRLQVQEKAGIRPTPAASAESVKESGRAAGSPGVAFVRYKDGRAVFEVQSGEYQFT
jgi:alpha-L-rhamnosidase